MDRSLLCIINDIIHLAPSKDLFLLWPQQKQRFPYLPDLQQVVDYLHSFNGQKRMPASLRKSQTSESLLLYGPDYFLGLYQSPQQDGYILSYIEPFNLQAHEQLARGVLSLHVSGYMYHDKLSYFPHDSRSHWEMICGSWQHLETQRRLAQDRNVKKTNELTPAQENYLNCIETLIGTTRQLEQEKYKLSTPIPYSRIKAADDERYVRDLYGFRLATQPAWLSEEKYLLRIKEKPDLRGRVYTIRSDRLTVKFEHQIDKSRIPPQGNFEFFYSNTIFDAQQNAIELLREHRAKNPHLLRILVDHDYQDFDANQIDHPVLNSDQRKALQHAIAAPDLLLVLGPPGTGKTTTITEIARHCGSRGRVLITAGTHKAVDNVLAQIDTSLEVIRWGHEDKVAENTRHLLLDEKTKILQRDILERTRRQATMLAPFLAHKIQITHWLDVLGQHINQLTDLERKMNMILLQQVQAVRRVEEPYKAQLDELGIALQQTERKLFRYSGVLSKWQDRQVAADERRQIFLLGRFFLKLSHHCEKYIQSTWKRIDEEHRVFNALYQEQETAQTTLQQALWADSEYRLWEDNKQQTTRTQSDIQQDIKRVMGLLQGTIQEHVATISVPSELTIAALQHYLAQYKLYYPLLERRARLIDEWRTLLESRVEDLRPELLRFANIVGATCIGAATLQGLGDIEFDLVIVDEAGQISLPDLLVPLVRAKRVVLVGDHQQLPPFVSNEVQSWLKGRSVLKQEQWELFEEETEGIEIADLLTKSTFELLFRSADERRHLVRLTKQYRMPQAIADFVSRHFYNQQLHTVTKRVHRDHLFQRSLVFIDTSDVSYDQRKETPRGKSENWGTTSYINDLEATLITRIAASYERRNIEWVIIAAYRAQVLHIISQLRRSADIHNTDLEGRVATVDSFQGGECGRIIYSFTRSNPQGKIGFLKELRRLNVAITRAQEQLVLVGDLSTLERADTANFRKLIISLRDYTRRHGQLLTYAQCEHLLSQSEQREGNE